MDVSVHTDEPFLRHAAFKDNSYDFRAYPVPRSVVDFFQPKDFLYLRGFEAKLRHDLDKVFGHERTLKLLLGITNTKN